MIRLSILIKALCIFLVFFGIHTSLAKEPGVSNNQILIGTTTPLSGPAAEIGTLISKIGAGTYFRHINAIGGINGRKIKYKIYDDALNPVKAVENTKALIEKDKVFCLFTTFGTSANLNIMPLLSKYTIPLFGPISLSQKLTDPLNHFIFTLYPNYFTQSQKIVAYSKSISNKVAVLYQDSLNGREVFQGTKAAIKKRGLKLVGESAINPKDFDLSAHLLKLMNVKEKPDTVIIFTHYIQAARILRQAQQHKFTPQFIVILPIATQRFIKTAGDAAEGTVVITIVPDAETSPKPGVIKYRDHLKKYFPKQKPTTESLIGYTSAKVLVEALKRTGRDITRDKFIKTLEKMREYQTGIIYPVSFTPKNHLGTKCPFFNRITKGKFHDFKFDCGGEG